MRELGLDATQARRCQQRFHDVIQQPAFVAKSRDFRVHEQVTDHRLLTVVEKEAIAANLALAHQSIAGKALFTQAGVDDANGGGEVPVQPLVPSLRFGFQKG